MGHVLSYSPYSHFAVEFPCCGGSMSKSLGIKKEILSLKGLHSSKMFEARICMDLLTTSPRFRTDLPKPFRVVNSVYDPVRLPSRRLRLRQVFGTQLHSGTRGSSTQKQPGPSANLPMFWWKLDCWGKSTDG